MKLRPLTSFSFLAALVFAAAPGCSVGTGAAPDSKEVTAVVGEGAAGWETLPKILARIVPPKFPDKIFAVIDYGAVGDGKTDCTGAFKKAIEACHRAGGGKVLVPQGVFLSGAIHLKSNVNLHIVKEGTIRFSTDPKAFLPIVFTRFESTEVMNYSPFIYAFEQENIAITGEGTLDGQGSASVWHQWKISGSADNKRLVEMGDQGVPVAQRVFGDGHKIRPNFVQPVHCKNVLIQGIRLIDSPMWVLNPLYCTNVTVRGVTIDTKGKGGKAPNTDGCDPESSIDVLIEDCVFNTDDDCIAIKSGRDADGRRVNRICQNVVIRKCRFQAGHGGVTAGSETAAGIRNVFIENCSFDSADLKMAIRLKTNPRRGGFIENFFVRDCAVKTAVTGIHMTMQYDKVTSGDAIPFIRNVDIRNITFENLKQALVIEGLSESAKISNVTIADCNFQNAEQKSVITNAVSVHFVNVRGLEEK